MDSMNDILATLRNERERLFSTYQLREMAIFGSFARGDHGADSDIDIMIETERPIGIAMVDLHHELSVMLGRKIDLATKASIRPWYMRTIQTDLIHV
jgi:uncharacterized protein